MPDRVDIQSPTPKLHGISAVLPPSPILILQGVGLRGRSLPFLGSEPSISYVSPCSPPQKMMALTGDGAAEVIHDIFAGNNNHLILDPRHSATLAQCRQATLFNVYSNIRVKSTISTREARESVAFDERPGLGSVGVMVMCVLQIRIPWVQSGFRV